MSHFTVLVIGADFVGQLEPFQENNMGDCPEEYLEFNDMTDELTQEFAELDEEKKAKYPTLESYADDYHGYRAHQIDGETRYGYYENPNARWDWYQVGGRWSGMLKLKPGASGEMGQRSWTNRDETISANFCDSAKKGDIDFESMRNEAGEEATKRYDEAHAIIAGRTWMPWSQVCDTIKEGSGGKDLWDTRRSIYNNQDALKDLRAKFDNPFSDLDEYLTPREKYINTARNAAGVTFAVIKDGEWYEKGSMGWWGMVANEQEQEVWNEKFAKLIDELPDDTYLTVVDCHI
jgi:hypothetical protein